MQRIIRPYIKFSDVKEGLRDIFASGILTRGKFAEGFRKSIKGYTGAKYSFLTTSATTALWLSLKAAGVESGDEVVVSDFSFPATANVVEDLGAKPVFADVDLNTFNMLPGTLESKITRKTKAAIFVDALGNPSGLLEIKEICRKRKIILIEDAACAFGSRIGSRKCGNISDITCFSFHPRKLLTTGEGGAITTNIKKFADFFAIKLEHGAVAGAEGWDFIDYGYNFRLSEIQALLGLKQVKKIGKIIKSRQKVRNQYIKCLEPLGFQAQRIDKNIFHNIQSLVFKVPRGIKTTALIRYLYHNNIESAIGTYCLSNTSYYRKKYKQIQPNARYLQEHTITLPCFEGVKTRNICQKIIGCIKLHE